MNLAQYIEHTNLNEAATEANIKKLCEEALQYGFYGVCIYPKWVKFAKSIVKDECKVITVISFPEGDDPTDKKMKDTELAVADGADEIDMVINKNMLKSVNLIDSEFQDDINAVVLAANKKPVKVIIEAAELNKEQKIKAIKLAIAAGAKFIKTSTGKSKMGGATIEDVKLIKSIVGDKLGIKAAGGIDSQEKAEALIKAGATRIGASKSIPIIMGW
jgi:deoxyribose-phosphate aldolase